MQKAPGQCGLILDYDVKSEKLPVIFRRGTRQIGRSLSSAFSSPPPRRSRINRADRETHRKSFHSLFPLPLPSPFPTLLGQMSA